MRLKATCYQCGREKVGQFDGWNGPNARIAFDVELEQSGWYLHSGSMRFCPICATSARLALGMDDNAGASV